MIGPKEQTRFSSLHTWAYVNDDGTVTVGITAYAAYQLGELQYVGFPRLQSKVKKDAAFGEVESVKTASDLLAPCSGTVTEINSRLIDDPAMVNRDPYGEGWVIRLEPSDLAELESLMDEAAYDASVANEEH